MSKPRLLLVDGSSWLFRSYHAPALSYLTNVEGQPTGAMFGVNRMIDQTLKAYPCEYVGIVFDPRGKTRRHGWLESYKANRPPAPKDLISQIPPLHEIIRARGLACIIAEGEEADDAIGTLTKQGEAAGLEVIIATGDKDMAQLVSPNVILINSIKNQLDEMGESEVMDKFGVRPDQIADYLALMGDSVDNIPGVPGVGKKTAAKLLTEHENLEGIAENVSSIKGKVGQSLADHVGDFELLRRLTTIICDLPLGIEMASLRPQAPDVPTLRGLYESYGFSASLRALDEMTDAAGASVSDPEEILSDALSLDSQTLPDFLQQLIQPIWVHPLSTYVGHQWQPQLHGVVIGDDDQVGVVRCNPDDWLMTLSPLIQYLPKLTQWYCHDYKSWLHHFGWQGEYLPFDLMLASYVSDSSKKHDLTQMSEAHGAALEALQKQFKKLDLDQIDWQGVAQTLHATFLEAHGRLSQRLEVMPKQQALLNDMEMPLSKVLWSIEQNGVMADGAALKIFGEELAVQIEHIETQAYALAGESFNLDSPKQIRAILFDKLALPTFKKTASGEASTNEEVLQKLASEGYEIADYILQRRHCAKLKSTYTDGLQKHIDSNDSRIHSKLNQAIANTGRLSSSSPNLQNIPIRSAEGGRLREAFIVGDNHQLIAADYSQVELRVLAHLCDDQQMQQAFSQGLDIHAATASDIFSVSLDAVSSDQRRYAKTINFGLIYGMSAFSLSGHLGISREEANQYIKAYFAKYPSVQDYMESNKALAHEQGYVETMFGRRIMLPEIRSKNHVMRQYAERAAINAPIQGAAADIMKMAMLAMDALVSEDASIRMTLQVHDELLFEVTASESERWGGIIKDCMESVTQLSVPLKVDVGVGQHWAQAH